MNALEKLGYKKVFSGFSDMLRYEKKAKSSVSTRINVVIITENEWNTHVIIDEEVYPYEDVSRNDFELVAAIEEVQRMRWGDKIMSFPKEMRKKVHENAA